ncbi:XrtA/PEP-CTERM system amidotransferase [Zooshikella harenae]|uniref:asparagine synthase (glutamine-hydrolyzing) n=1 Tax=Zooshikella harenae TaxID=2827238 RepID=A0ABS5Z789_9GAMM|nr:XrtA/PEP-CTERM system amidotransferase [Zooshikella harenae]MBU2709914.1 amidotransferase 1, exosortase A system-associated [Zooshikella harenae]
MCGIAGIFHIKESAGVVDRALLTAMNNTQFHRGPDEGGVHIEPGVGLAHRRLSIIDISTGQQPLFNDDGSVAIVFNGEIYNFQDLRQELIAKGYQFKTHSDTETIVYAWIEWGEECVKHLRGMFAFAIWDRNRQQLFIARDRLGIKPLFFATLATGEFMFASELKVLLAHPRLKRDIYLPAIEDYFTFGYIPEPNTIFKDVFKLSPGHTLTLTRGMVEPVIKAYWDVPFTQHPDFIKENTEAQLVEQLRQAIDVRMVSEVPLGAFLSGGVDSSAVVAMMAGLQKDPVNTCSIAFNEADFNESEFAKEVAQQYHTNHWEKTVAVDDFELLDKLALLYDEPYADSSAMPTYRVCELAKQRVTVVLSGDGGDEVFAGYRRYRWHMNEERVRSRIPLGFRKPVFGLLGELYPKADWAPRIFRAKTTFQSLARTSVEAYLHSVSILNDQQRNDLFSDQFKRDLQGYHSIEVFKRHAANCQTDDPLSLIQYLDMKTYLVGDILTKVDRASMAHSLEVRVPFLDHKLIEWSMNVPSAQKLHGQEGKYVLKKALEPHLSNNILYRDKMGFAVPVAKWFRGPLKERLKQSVLSEQMLDSGYFNADYLRQLVTQHQSGLRDHSAALWTLSMFEAFLRQVLSADSAVSQVA